MDGEVLRDPRQRGSLFFTGPWSGSAALRRGSSERRLVGWWCHFGVSDTWGG